MVISKARFHLFYMKETEEFELVATPGDGSRRDAWQRWGQQKSPCRPGIWVFWPSVVQKRASVLFESASTASSTCLWAGMSRDRKRYMRRFLNCNHLTSQCQGPAVWYSFLWLLQAFLFPLLFPRQKSHHLAISLSLVRDCYVWAEIGRRRLQFLSQVHHLAFWRLPGWTFAVEQSRRVPLDLSLALLGWLLEAKSGH